MLTPFSGSRSVFILMTGEWVDAMQPAAALLGTGVSAFFIAVVVIGRYLLMNLLVAVILTEFADTSGDSSPAGSPRKRSPAVSRASSPTAILSEDAPSLTEPQPDYALCCLGPRNPLRRYFVESS